MGFFQVSDSTPSESAGLRAGDVISAINGKDVSNLRFVDNFV